MGAAMSAKVLAESKMCLNTWALAGVRRLLRIIDVAKALEYEPQEYRMQLNDDPPPPPETVDR